MHVALHDVSKAFTTTRGPQKPFTLSTPSAALLYRLWVRSTWTSPPGEFVGILGPSGCGKSTLLRLIAAQIAPTTGTIHLDGEAPIPRGSANRLPGWHRIPDCCRGREDRTRERRFTRAVNRKHQRPAPDPQELLDMVQLAAFADAIPLRSRGMQRSVSLSRTLATGASLWLMDEPFAALDELTRERLADEVLRLWRVFKPAKCYGSPTTSSRHRGWLIVSL